MRDRVKQFWQAKDAEAFDRIARHSGRMAAIARVAELARPYVTIENAVSVDLGCGTGLFAEAVGNRSIVGVDFSRSLLVLARKRMDTVRLEDILDFAVPADSIDNIVSLFTMDDYPPDTKRFFFERTLSFLKSGGHLFFSAYSPADEWMGSERRDKRSPGLTVYLEPASFYETGLQDWGYMVDNVDIVRSTGVIETASEAISVEREFIVVVAHKRG